MLSKPQRRESQSTESDLEPQGDGPERGRAEPSAAKQAVANEQSALESGEESPS